MIDLSLLPPPDVVETLEFETLYQQILGDFRAHMGDQWTAVLESDPVVKLLEVAAYQKMLGRARINAAAKASLLAYARGADLDNRGADFDVQRLELVAADPDAVPPVAAVMEKDDDYLYRIRLSLERLSVAGGRGAYEYHALTASGDVASVSVDSPTFKAAEISAQVRALLPAGAIVLVCDYAAGLSNPLPGDVSLAVLPIVGSAADPAALVAAVQKAVANEEVRPITDRPRCVLGQPDEYYVIAELEVLDGPSLPLVVAEAKAKLATVIAAARDLEGELSLSAIYGALHVSGVRRVVLKAPTADVLSDKRHYPSCIGVDVRGVVVA